MRERRQIIKATAVAAALSGAPSTFDALCRDRELRSMVRHVREATCAAGTLVPPGRPGFGRGALVHVAVSAAVGEGLARLLPAQRTVRSGAAAGFVIGVANIVLIGRRFPAIRALPVLPQLADHVAFGVVFALVVDR